MKQVLDKVRRDGLVQTAAVALARLDKPVAPGYATSGTVLAAAADVWTLRSAIESHLRVRHAPPTPRSTTSIIGCACTTGLLG